MIRMDELTVVGVYRLRAFSFDKRFLLRGLSLRIIIPCFLLFLGLVEEKSASHYSVIVGNEKQSEAFMYDEQVPLLIGVQKSSFFYVI
jgi:hypothetical protein